MAVTINSPNQHFVDIDLTFSSNPITGDVAMKVDAAAVKQSVIMLVMTQPYEVPFHPEVSCQASGMLFELDSPFTRSIIESTIVQVLAKFEPRIQLISVKATPSTDNTSWKIVIVYTIIGSNIPYTVQTILSRSR
jgi:phage baseplate assembly protein W